MQCHFIRTFSISVWYEHTFIFYLCTFTPVARPNITESEVTAYVPFITFSIFLCWILFFVCVNTYSSLPVRIEFIDHIRQIFFFASLKLAQINGYRNSDLIRFSEAREKKTYTIHKNVDQYLESLGNQWLFPLRFIGFSIFFFFSIIKLQIKQ